MVLADPAQAALALSWIAIAMAAVSVTCLVISWGTGRRTERVVPNVYYRVPFRRTRLALFTFRHRHCWLRREAGSRVLRCHNVNHKLYGRGIRT